MWRRIIILSHLLFGLTNIAFNQITTNSIVNTNVTWSGMRVHYSDNKPFSVSSNYIRFLGDTVVEKNEYKKVWESDDSLAVNWKVIGIIREERTRTYYRPSYLPVDCVLYDFSLKIGDTISIRWRSVDEIFDYMRVFQKDSIILNGIKRLRIQLSEIHYGFKETWIEDIGSLNGVLNSSDESVGKPILLCVHQDGNKIYTNESYPNCYYTLKSINTNVEIFPFGKIMVFPNPFSNTFQVTSPEIFHNVELIDIFGRRIFTNSYTIKTQVVNFSLPYLPSGIYFLKITTENNHEVKIIKIQKLN